ncbi:Lipoprotein NlpI precursor [Limihaloglobus sulfuriphilus]|uniref:Lipoprotein NlpI n=1 Tax=Limihaloglobus sulfuriphilus TaxID=1851148 RepID=A0A1Q2MHU5_9BACT|nr:tetratricopeptide repeat protein [Limihaloglobus sulfuriphilus]AQQ71867.1 Lipoprotein NlpI precursor [Limihaloglobus sulfuriphilus]
MNKKMLIRLGVIAIVLVGIFAAIVYGTYYHDVRFYTKYGELTRDANRFFQDGEYENSMACVEEAIEMLPQDISNYHMKAYIYYEMGDEQAAKEQATWTVENSSNSMSKCENLLFRAGLYSEMGLEELAMADYDAAIELVPDYPDLYSSRASALSLNGNYEAAVADYAKMLELNPNSAIAYWNRGCGYYKLGEFELAEKDFTSAKEVVRSAGEMAGLHTDWAICEYRSGDLEGAKEKLAQAYEYYPEFVTHMADYLVKMPPLEEIQGPISPVMQLIVEPVDLPIICYIVSTCAAELEVLSAEDAAILAAKSGIN